MIRQLFIILMCLALGEIIVYFTGIKIPSSIIGMLLLTAGLHFKIIKLKWIQEVADFLLDNMVFFFIPPGVAIMCYLDLISKELVPILAAILGSTVLVLLSTSFTHQVLRKIRLKKLTKDKK
ncbi:CidA/LrgA family protein [Polaribacter sp. Z014]|uniref:CidA/LrgA family protein n=1 Tax=Polaribacter sejongensis TaxID=985043 RepID=A0AAJ1VF34_9FLAO|nr:MULTISPECIES: CidA/LrgA family protein [Polaribacter]MCL7764889.1 CidA/LrgA family protein [Polaribacter sp. Z014]MDN3618009.1 CidA/LrgA family protein [Polaribacter undariae]UWD31959.1 CidA/LrgA family protein [Polaribacter undariae]